MGIAITYLCLTAAIVTEVIGTTALAASDGFSKLLPSVVAVVCFVAAFWLLVISASDDADRHRVCRLVRFGDRLDNGRCLGLGKAGAGHSSPRWHGPHYGRRDRNERILEIRSPLNGDRARSRCGVLARVSGQEDQAGVAAANLSFDDANGFSLSSLQHGGANAFMIDSAERGKAGNRLAFTT